jgi:NAD(P)-dependent dehydrogenase (short-subunit alcohol dehydrogenase family)
MKPPFPSLTAEWHNSPYPALSPSQSHLSTSGKTILITGGGRGIGARIAYAFAASGASIIAITGRTESSLTESKKDIETAYPSVKVLTLPVDVTDAPGIETAFKKVSDENDGRGIDIFIHNAGVAPAGARISDVQSAADRQAWWQGYEINVLGTMTVLSAFTRHKAADAKLVFIGTAASAVFPYGMLGTSGYSMSKSAAAVLVQYFAAENPEVKVFTMHPGVVMTEMGSRGKKSGANTLPVDDSQL